MVSMDILDLYREIRRGVVAKMKLPFLPDELIQLTISNQWIYTLATVLSKTEKTKEEKVSYGVAISFIQLALNLHDNVSLQRDDESIETNRLRQVTVLAGDYYSGRYYELLSKLNDNCLINEISKAIRVINENKVYIENHHGMNSDEMSEAITILETHIIEVVSHYFSVEINMEEYYLYLSLRRLEKEILRSNDKKALQEIHGKVQTLTEKNEMLVTLEQIS